MMAGQLRTDVAFHFTGQTAGADLEPVTQPGLRPALLARYHDLTALRYDFPLVLVDGATADTCVRPLSAVIDDVLHEVAQGDAAERTTRHVLRLERDIRARMAGGDTGTLDELWQRAADQLTASPADAAVADSFARARTALPVRGVLADCDEHLPACLVQHVWLAVQSAKARRLEDHVDRLRRKLADILRADLARSAAGRSAATLRQAVGTGLEDRFDFEALSHVLTRAAPATTLPAARRQRIESLLVRLQSQPFYPPRAFQFTNCTAALAAWRRHLPDIVAYAKAVAMAELESEGEYQPARHDAFFDAFSADTLDEQDLALFPDVLVAADRTTMGPAEQSALMEMLSSGLPMKVLVHCDDVLDEIAPGDRRHRAGLSGRQLAHMAIGLNNVYVLETPASHLFQVRERLIDGLAYHGAALFSVFSGATGHTDGLPPYLVAAVALQSRVCPIFAYDPSSGSDWAARFNLDGNPQPDQGWTVEPLAYEDREHRRQSADVALTLADFVACDHRYAKHFARVPESRPAEHLVSVADFIARGPAAGGDAVPYTLLVDATNHLQRVLVDDRVIRDARRCLEVWRGLQELAGIRDSRVDRVPAHEQASGGLATPAAAGPTAAPQQAASPAAAGAAPADASEPGPAPGEPYIETPRCTSCNECRQINDRMFAYNENKQAFIANPDAGTFAQLVEAAESCQVSIIHPGKPRHPHESGLEELIARAEPFQ
jgi:hypothetical protein